MIPIIGYLIGTYIICKLIALFEVKGLTKRITFIGLVIVILLLWQLAATQDVMNRQLKLSQDYARVTDSLNLLQQIRSYPLESEDTSYLSESNSKRASTLEQVREETKKNLMENEAKESSGEEDSDLSYIFSDKNPEFNPSVVENPTTASTDNTVKDSLETEE